MNQYDDLASSAAYRAGRSAARDLSSAGAGPGDGPQYLPRGLHPVDEATWLLGLAQPLPLIAPPSSIPRPLPHPARMSNEHERQLRQFIQPAESQGWTVTRTGGDHWRFTPPTPTLPW